MTWDWTVKVTDLCIVFATLVGPVLAVQAQKILELRREHRQRQAWIFRVLMTTRATLLAPDHVQALNAVPIEFYGSREPSRSILNTWKVYIDHLGNKDMPMEAWGEKRLDLMIDLLGKISRFLGYDFDPVELKKEIYAPEGHARIETEQEIIRRGLLAVLTGKASFPMEVKGWPVNEEALAAQREIQNRLLAWFDGKLAPVVKTEPR